MSRYLLILTLLTSLLFGKSDDIPFDWSGQYGVISNNGRLMWNQDWVIGPLLIDGSFSNYPTRFGIDYANNYKLHDIGDIYNKKISFPDSSIVNSKIDYNRGDFSYDQLDVDLNFEKRKRIISFNGFKRTYGGAYGQYRSISGANIPLQQSYRLDYSSVDDNNKVDISVGYFLTDGRLNQGYPTDFVHKEKILSTGIGYSKDYSSWNYSAKGAIFQQYYKLELDSEKFDYNSNIDKINTYLNRFNTKQVLSRELSNSAILKIGLNLDNQGISFVDSTKKSRSWSTIFTGWENPKHGVKLGTSFTKKEIVPYLESWVDFEIGNNLKLNSLLKYEANPKHPVFWEESDNKMFEKWLTASLKSRMTLKNIPLDIDVNYYNVDDAVTNDKFSINNNLLSSSINTVFPLFRNWKIDLQYRHIFKHNVYSDGIEDHVNVGLILSEYLFKNNLFAILKIWGEGHFNNSPYLRFNGYHYGPETTDDTELTLPDYWVLNMELSAKISKMTIIWKVNNILQTINMQSNNQIFSNFNQDYLLINNNNNFPPLNRFVTLNIIWEFDN